MQLRNLITCMLPCLLLSAPALADPVVGVNSLFFYGLDYQNKPQPLKLILQSQQSLSTREVALPSFGEYLPGAGFSMPVGEKLEFTVQDGDKALKTITLRSNGNRLDVDTDCRRQQDLHTAFPYYPFSSYIPPGTITFMCDTSAGALEVRFICRSGDPDCWSRPPRAFARE